MTESSTRHPISVGYDGSESARAALAWAIGEAEARDCAVHVVAACPVGPASPWALPGTSGWHLLEMDRAEQAVREAEKAADGRVPVTSSVHEGAPSRLLAKASRHCDLLVVGSAGHVGLGGWVGGSVSRYLLHHSACPLVVIGPESVAAPVRRLVVSPAVDPDGEAFRTVAEWQLSRSLPVHVVSSFAMPVLMPDIALTFDRESVRSAVAEQTAAYVERLRLALPPGTQVTSELDEGLPIEALDRHTRSGDLLVVPRGREHDVPFAHGRCPACVV